MVIFVLKETLFSLTLKTNDFVKFCSECMCTLKYSCVCGMQMWVKCAGSVPYVTAFIRHLKLFYRTSKIVL